MRTFICAAAVGLFACGAAWAVEAPSAMKAGKDAAARQQVAEGRALYVCEDTALTRRAAAREFGAVEFVTAEAATSGSNAWARPKCITASEARRLKHKLATS